MELDAALEEIRYLNRRQQLHPSTWLNRNLLSEQTFVRPTSIGIPNPLLASPLLIPNTRISSDAFADRRRELLVDNNMSLKRPCIPPSLVDSSSSSNNNNNTSVQSQRQYVDETDITDLDILCGRGGKSNK